MSSWLEHDGHLGVPEGVLHQVLVVAAVLHPAVMLAYVEPLAAAMCYEVRVRLHMGHCNHWRCDKAHPNLFELFSWEDSFHGVSQRYLFVLDQIPRGSPRVVDFPKMAPAYDQTNRLFVNFYLRDRVDDRYNHFFRAEIYLLLVFYRTHRRCLPFLTFSSE